MPAPQFNPSTLWGGLRACSGCLRQFNQNSEAHTPPLQAVFQQRVASLELQVKSEGRNEDGAAVTVVPEDVRKDLALYAGCMAGASLLQHLEQVLTGSGFVQIRIKPKDESKTFIRDWAPGRNTEDFIVSATIKTIKPATVSL